MLDLKKLINTCSLYNLHSHTQFCDGNANMEDFVSAAVKSGFEDYGFSPHSPVLIDSPCNMKFSDVEIYLSEFNRLRGIYSDRINLYASMEIDYMGEGWGPSNEYFRTLHLDYRIGSVHFIPSPYGYIDVDGRYSAFKEKMSRYFDNDIEHVVRSFYEQTMQMIEKGGFDIIGHFDKIGHNAGHFKENIECEDWYYKLIVRTLEAIKEHNLIVEINTKALADHKRLFPNLKYFEMLRKYEIPVLINSDAHQPELINAGRSEAAGYFFG